MGKPKANDGGAVATGRGKSLSPATQRAIWARSGGVCAFPGCSAVLYEDPVFADASWYGELAHNVASSSGGPRGDASRSAALSDDPDNLILMCPTHHALVDKKGWEERYPEELLARWKQQHEAAVRFAGQHSHGRLALGLRYRGVIGKQIMAGDPATIRLAALQRDLVLAESPVELQVDASAYPAQSEDYWRHVVTQVRQQVRMLQSRTATDRPIAVYALADMPALMALGFALGHSAELYPFQWDRYANSWVFAQVDAPPPAFQTHFPPSLEGPVALVLSLSGTIAPERIRAAFPGAAPAVITLTVEEPRLDLVQGPRAIDAFRLAVARVIEELEKSLPRATSVHVFPAMPAPLAVVFGMAIQPKVSFPFQIYDAEGREGEFHPALSLPLHESSR